MVELHRRDDGARGPVVHELRPLVEVRAVVLVALDDEVRPRARAVAEVEFRQDAAQQKTGIPAGRAKDVHEQARRGGLAVGTRDDERAAITNEEMGQRLGQRLLGEAGLAGGGGLGVGRQAGVADDDEIGYGRVKQAVAVEPFVDRDIHLRESGAHRRVGGLVGAANRMAGLVKQPRERPHAGPADADQVDVAKRIGGRRGRTVEDAQVGVGKVGELLQENGQRDGLGWMATCILGRPADRSVNRPGCVRSGRGARRGVPTAGGRVPACPASCQSRRRFRGRAGFRRRLPS